MAMILAMMIAFLDLLMKVLVLLKCFLLVLLNVLLFFFFVKYVTKLSVIKPVSAKLVLANFKHFIVSFNFNIALFTSRGQ